MKKIATIAGSVALFVATVIPSFAAGNNCGNGTTGPFSHNTCTVNNTSNVTVSNVNDAKITNNVTATSNSGHNSASFNTLGGSIQTGNSTLNATVSTVANVNTTNITGGPAASGNTGSNSITGPGFGGLFGVDAGGLGGPGGPGGTNDVYINNERRVAVENNNTAKVTNNVDVTSDSGNNKASFNTGPATVKTGNSGLLLNVGTHTNDNDTRVSAGAGGTGGNVAGNSTTGPFSGNSVFINNISDIGVKNINDMLVRNNVDAKANSGWNRASFNTLGGAIQTGNVGAGVGVDTEGNINTSLVEASMGAFSNGGVNDVTGPGSTNDTYLNNEQRIVVDNFNNKCRSHNRKSIFDGGECKPWELGVFNYVDSTADVGHNKADGNTAGGSVTAAMADLVQNVLTHINDSWTEIRQ